MSKDFSNFFYFYSKSMRFYIQCMFFLLSLMFERILEQMRHTLLILFLIIATVAGAQTKRVENRPYCDLRPFHLGVVVGTHWQDTEFRNVGMTMVPMEDGTMAESIVTCDQDNWDFGFQVGVLGELRINSHFAFRIAPTVSFGNRHFTFRNLTQKDVYGQPEVKHQDMKTVYVGSNFDLIFAAKRFNNHRPYVMAGIVPMANLTTRANDYLQMKSFDAFVEFGVGCDFYLPYFKLRPEVKFMFGLVNALNTDHPNQLNDPAKYPYAVSVDRATSKMIALTFYFE